MGNGWLLRKVWHISTISVGIAGTYYLIQNYSYRFALFFLLICLFVVLIAEYMRLELKISPYKFLLKKKEENKIVTSLECFIAAIIVVAIFDFKVAIAAALIMALSDPIATLVGSYFGKIKLINGRTLEGTLAGFITSLIITFIILKPHYIVIVLMSLVAATVELLSTKRFDDNLMVPIIAGFVAQVLVFAGL